MIRNSFVVMNPTVLHQEAEGFENSAARIKSPGPADEEISTGGGGWSSILPLLRGADPQAPNQELHACLCISNLVLP